MFARLFSRLAAGRKSIDLDDPGIVQGKLEVCDPKHGPGTPRSMILLFLQLVLRQVLKDGAIAVNLFYDDEDRCLRVIEYFSDAGPDGEPRSRELAPAPGYIAQQVFAMLRSRLEFRGESNVGVLRYKYDGLALTSVGHVASDADVRVFLSEDRPRMRIKVTAVK